jgi:transcriptional regulator with XRE-family HTH domain
MGKDVGMSDDAAVLLAAVDPVVLGRRIKQARVRGEMTQGQLAGDHASIGYVSRIESGQRRPELALLESLAARLGTTAASLLTGAPDPTSDRIRVLLDHADLALRGGAPEDAQRLLGEAGAELDGDVFPELHRRWLYLGALTAEANGEIDDAIVGLEDLIASDAEAPDVTRVAIALSRNYRESGDFSRAIETGQRCLDSLRAKKLDGSDEAVQLAVTVAAAHFVQGDESHAVRLCKRAITRAEEMGTPVAMASAYWNASIMESERGDSRAAVVMAERALQLLDAEESNRNLARLRSTLGAFQLRLDPPDIEGALANLAAAAAQLDWSSASPIDRGGNTILLAKAKLLQGSPDEAYTEAATVLAELRHIAPIPTVSALIVMGQASFAQADAARAADHYRDAVAVLSGFGLHRKAAECWFELGVLLDELGLESEAHDAYRSAAASTGLFSLHDLARRVDRPR